MVTALQGVGTFVDTDTVFAMLEGEREIDGPYSHLSFDDGFKNILENAAPVLHELGVPAIAFVPSAMLGADYATIRNYCLETTKYPAVIEMLGPDDLGRLSELGVEIGSHTRTHARFSELSSPESREEEIAGSKRELEARTGVECKYIAWPFGRLEDVDEVSLKATRDAGYRACFGAVRGSVVPGKTDLFAIPRHQVEAGWPVSHALYFSRGKMEMSV